MAEDTAIDENSGDKEKRELYLKPVSISATAIIGVTGLIWFAMTIRACNEYELLVWPWNLEFINAENFSKAEGATSSCGKILLEQYNDYFRMYGVQSLSWFFFAATINGAIAGWLVGLGRVKAVKLLPLLFIGCNSALAIGYAWVLPSVYHGYATLIQQEIAAVGVGAPGTPEKLWSVLALLVSGTFFSMAGFWWLFFFTKPGLKLIEEVQPDKPLPNPDNENEAASAPATGGTELVQNPDSGEP